MNNYQLSSLSVKPSGVAALAAVFVLLTVLFVVAPLPGGDDWETFYGASQRVLHGTKLYGTPVTHGYYSNPPWLALLLTPLALLPEKLGWAILSTTTLGVVVLLVQRWSNGRAGFVKTVLALLSPPMFYILLHGEIDALVIAMALLPAEWWPVGALTKPQIAIGLLLGVPRAGWARAAMILGVLGLVTVILFGFWPLDLITQPTPFQNAAHNMWYGLWPFQVPAGLAILLIGARRKDERLLIAGSPLVSPYATTSTLIGPWIVAMNYLTDRQAALVWASWWRAVIYRMLV